MFGQVRTFEDNVRIVTTEPSILTAALQTRIAQEIASSGGWLAFDRFMALALYEPGLGYYANDTAKFGLMPSSGSDFVTAPEMSPVFGQLLAAQVAEALQRTHTREVWEFGAGTGALALQVLDELAALGVRPDRYTIVDLSGTLRARQQLRLVKYESLVHWADALPDRLEGVVIGNEVLDAMPVQLLVRKAGVWHERGVVLKPDGSLGWEDRPTPLRPPMDKIGRAHV